MKKLLTVKANVERVLGEDRQDIRKVKERAKYETYNIN